MPETCPKCGAVNPPGRHTCWLCGAELEAVSFAELFGAGMFGPPKQLKGRYAIERAVSQGTQVSLYRARDTQTNRPCLVHQAALVSLDVDVRDALEHRFLQEAAVWSSRRHPNILPILDADVQSHRLYLITEPIKGVSLRSVIEDRQQVVSEQTLLHWAGQLCDALEYLHTQDPPVVLGCLSPSTIHVDETGQVQIVKVGLIRYDRSGLFEPARGVPGYAAPEQRSRQVTPLSDLYTLGIVLYQVITRFDPKERPLPALTKYGAGFSESVLQAIVRAYRREPEKRFSSAAEMRQALLGASSGQVPQLPPFELVSGRRVSTVPDMVQTCALNWDDGLLALISGRIAEWLARAAAQLRQSGRGLEAEQVQRAWERTLGAQEQIASEAARPGMHEIAPNAAWAAWLRDLGAMGIQPSLEFHPARFDFGVVAPTVRARTALHIRNKGQGYLSGRVESKLPWIAVPQPAFGCRAGEAVEVRVEAHGRRLLPGASQSLQAIHVTSTGGEAWIAAQAASSPPSLDVQPQMLDYGPIARGASRVAHLILSNKGGGRLSGQVSSKAPWLRIRHPQFSCPAGASVRVAVELLSAALPPGAVRVRRALAVDSDSGQAQVDIAWQWARPSLELDKVGLDFGSAGRGEEVRQTLVLSNSGTADLVGRAESRVPWLDVQPSEFECAPGAVQTLTVACNTALLPGGSTVEVEAVVIAANAGTQTLSASVEVLAPELVLPTVQVDLGTLWDGEQAEETLMVGNQGSLLWEGTIHACVPWLRVEPVEIRCEPGHWMPVIVMVNAADLGRGGEWSADDAVQIRGMGEERSVRVRAFLSRPHLLVERHSLDFGLIGRTDVATLPLEIANDGTGELSWQAQAQGTWVEVVPSEGVCPAGQAVTVSVNAYALAVEGESGQAWITVRSNAGRADLPVRVGLSAPRLAVEALSLELESENYAPAMQTWRIFNRGVGRLSGTVVSRVPWLIVETGQFECEAGMSVPVEVRANLEGLREGRVEADDALRIESNGGEQEIAVSLTLVLVPQLSVGVQELSFGPEKELILPVENRGYGSLRVQVSPCVGWIAVDRRDWTIKGQKKIGVRVSLVGDPPADEGDLEIRTADQVVRLSVKVQK